MASAQSAAPGGKTPSASEIEEIQVFAQGSRLPTNITSVPGSVTIVNEKTIEQQAAISSDLGRMLAASVPGMSLSTGDGNNFSQTLRGRKPSFFIDGIPQSVNLRGGGRDLRIINPSVLERIEIINGATSIYGLGGSGGVVNYITKRPKAEGLELLTEVGLANSLSHMTSNGLEYSLTQGASYRDGRVDFVGNVNYVKRGLYYDGAGAPIPPDPTGQTGIADSRERTLFGKLGVDLTDNIRWEGMALDYDNKVNTDYTVGQGSFLAGKKSIAVPKRKGNIVVNGAAFDFVGTEDPSTKNTLGSTSLLFEDVLGSTVKAEAYYKYSKFVWRYLSYIPIAPTLGGFPPNGSQLKTFDNRWGGRVDVRTPIKLSYLDGSLLWGAEYSQNSTQEKLVDGRPRSSRITQDNYAAFAQLQADIFPWLHVRTGVRYDGFTLDIPSFKALDTFNANVQHTIIGKKLDFRSATGNFGLVGDLTQNVSLFGSWSNGFSIGNVVRAVSGLRPSRPGPSVTYDISKLGLTIEPVLVDSFEAGIRYNSDRITGSLTGFLNTSKLGATFDSVTLQVTRAPEEIWGYEAALEVKATDWLRVGGSYTWLKSHTDKNNDGVWDGPLDFSRVPPPILTTYVETDLPQGWTGRLQGSTLFSEKRFRRPWGSFQHDVKSYTIFDLSLSGPVLGGTLSLGVENLFNRNYYPFATYMNCTDNAVTDAYCATTAPGARGSIKYSIKY